MFKPFYRPFIGNETNSCLHNVETDTCNSSISGYDEQECIKLSQGGI